MKILKKDFFRLNFSDYPVKLMLLDKKLKILKIIIDGWNFRQTEGWKRLGEGTIKIFDWECIDVSMFLIKENIWIRFEDDIDYLKEICEMEFNENVVFRGFGKKQGNGHSLK